MKTIRLGITKIALFFLLASPALIWPAYADTANATITFEGGAYDSGTYSVTGWSWRTEREPNTGSGRTQSRSFDGNLIIEFSNNNLTGLLLEAFAVGRTFEGFTLVDGNLSIVAEGPTVAGVWLQKPGIHSAELDFSKFTYTTNSGSFCFDLDPGLSC